MADEYEGMRELYDLDAVYEAEAIRGSAVSVVRVHVPEGSTVVVIRDEEVDP